MSKFAERLAAAKAAPKPTREVTVTLDADLADEREALRAALEAARAEAAADRRLAETSAAEAEVQERLDALLEQTADSLVNLKFTRLPGDVWADITSRCPVRLDAPIDRRYGYDMQKASTFAARYVDPAGKAYGARVEDGAEVPMLVATATGDGPAVDEWADLFGTISGHEFILIMDAVYELNEYEPAARVDQLVKSLATRRA